jgi:hypothetical protein
MDFAFYVLLWLEFFFSVLILKPSFVLLMLLCEDSKFVIGLIVG